MAEIQKYDVVENQPGFQLRRYAPHSLVTKPMSGSMASAGNSAFGYLASYISGQNERGQQIAMTAPVLQQKTANGYEVSFVMPDELRDPPKPRPGLELRSIESKLMAAIKFSGSASDELFERKAKELVSSLEAAGYRVISEPLYARYNGPWTPPLLRRNEVLVEVESITTP